MQELLDYGEIFLTHWWGLASAGALLGADVAIGSLFPKLKNILDRIPIAFRRHIEVLFIVLAIFWSGYKVWSDEHANLKSVDEKNTMAEETIGRLEEERNALKSSIDEPKGWRDQVNRLQEQLDIANAELRNRSRDTSKFSSSSFLHNDQQLRNFALKLSVVGRPIFRINRVSNDNDTIALAREIYNSFLSAGWQPDSTAPILVGYIGITGVALSGRSAQKLPKEVVMKIKEAFASIGLQLPVDERANSFTNSEVEVEIFVGSPR